MSFSFSVCNCQKNKNSDGVSICIKIISEKKNLPLRYCRGFRFKAYLPEKTMEKDSQVQCLMCGAEIHGRSDRKFCSQNCKNRYHNGEVRATRLSRLRVTSRLDKNYSILKHMLSLGVTQLSRAQASQMGFSPDFFTSCFHDGPEPMCCVYDVSFRLGPSMIYDIKPISAT